MKLDDFKMKCIIKWMVIPFIQLGFTEFNIFFMSFIISRKFLFGKKIIVLSSDDFNTDERYEVMKLHMNMIYSSLILHIHS